jgi:hypothetical protein
MRSALLATLSVLLLSGCATTGSTGSIDPGAFKDVPVDGIRGIVVDQAIAPIAKVTVSLALPAGNQTATTDAQGRFTFGGLAPGTYFLSLTHLLYKPVKTSVEVKAGAAPQITRVQMEARFTAKPYSEQFKFKGIIACGYNAVLVTAPCLTDYSTIACAGGCVPQAHDTLTHAQGDNRAFGSSVSQDWQTIVLELVFKPNGQGTSDRMGVLLSYHNRTAADWFATADGVSPVKVRLETGVKDPSEQGTPELLAPQGRNDLLILGSIAASEGQNFGAGVNQEFQVFQTNFYNAKPPEGWSFANGDALPF